MLHQTARIFQFLVLSSVLWVTGCPCKTTLPSNAPPPPPAILLTVPFESQKGCDWCWNAATVMALQTMGYSADQCDVAQKVNPNLSCCPGNVPPGLAYCSGGGPRKPCDATGWPPFKILGFKSCRTKKEALTFQRLQYEIGTLSRPVLFTWEYTNWDGSRSGFGHMLLAAGYKTQTGIQYVASYDPLCTTGSALATQPCGVTLIPYDEYVAKKGEEEENGYLHWDDFYAIKKK